MARYENNRYEDYFFTPIERPYLDTLEEEKFSNDAYRNQEDLYVWRSFVNDLVTRKIKIKRNIGWFYDSNKKGDLDYTFNLYKKKFEKSPPTKTDKEDYLLKTLYKYNNIFEGIYNNYFYYEKSFFLSSWENKKDFYIETLKKIPSKLSNDEFNDFIDAIDKKKIKILEKPKSWFSKEPSFEENLKYTFEKYTINLSQLKTNPLYYENIDKLRTRRKVSKKISFKNNYPKIIEVYKKFVMDNDEQLDNLLNYLMEEKLLSEKKTYDNLVVEARRKYNLEKNEFNRNVENYDNLSVKMKEKTKAMEKRLDNFLEKLKPLIKKYDLEEKKYTKPDWQKKLDEEDLERERRKSREFQERKRKTEELKKYNQEIEDLEYKISDAQSKYSMNRAKLRKLDSKLKDIRILEKRRNELQEKLRLKNLKIEEKQQILKEKTELNEKLANIEKVKNQLADLKSKIPDVSTFEQEKTLRLHELEKLKKLNDTTLKIKDDMSRVFELMNIRDEIRIREQQRYEQEQREKEELKQAKIVFLKEKQITQRKLNILEKEHKYFNDRKIEAKKYEKEITEKKQEIQTLLSQTRSHLQNVKLEAEQKKLKTLELQKKTLQNKQDLAEQQKLFADSIQRDVNELNEQKDILKNITLENKKILTNVKKELSSRQDKIEKTLKLNLENMKEREAKILAEESKIKLDVFTTLEDVKEQTAIKLENERKLQELKDEIIRKQDVSDLLSETVDKISNNEISEAEEYNAFLESEIDFKKKLSNTLLTQKQVLEILTEEKKSYLDLLKDAKSQYLQDLLNAKRDIIEKNIKIALVEGKENLSYVTSGMKSEIETLQKEKEISQRRKELAEFQLDNYRRELNLRKQEIELLKNIRIKALQNERKIIRNEATSAISDMIKSIEKTERNADVREKLDEMLDDVENKEISEKSKAALFSIIDKIENKEIHDAAKEKLDFILGKIELHDNIDESKKALNKILDEIEDTKIREDVETKLDEILDDVELEDYDFLDEEDDFDSFLSNVKKHISGEKRMEQFSKVREIFEETKKEDTKLKMSENIEMRERGRERIGPEDYDVGETSFAEFDDYNLFVNNIENPEMRNKVKLILDNEDAFDKDKPPKMKNAYTSTINTLWQTDKLDNNYWDGNIILNEQAKFKYEQKINNLNTALAEYELHIDPTDLSVRTFLDIKLTETFSEKKGEINGYSYNGEKIISRNISRNFYFNYIKKPGTCQKFIDELKGKINNTARAQIASESFFEGEKAVKDCALEYIGELREEQSYQMEKARNGKEMKQALRDGNEIEKEIQNIKKNISFKMRVKIFRRTLSWRFTKLLRFLWKHKGKTSAGIATLLLTVLGVVMNQLGVIGIVHNLKKASAAVKQYANDVHDMGRKIIQNVQALYRIPGTIIGYTMIILAIFLRILYFATRLGGTYSSAAVFGALGITFEALIYFEGSADKINEKVADAMEETGNIIEDFGIRAEKRIVKQMPRWYWDKPTEEKTVLEIIESGAAKMTLSIARGTQKAGKKVEEAGEVVRNSIWYLKIFVLITAIFLAIIFTRNYIL